MGRLAFLSNLVKDLCEWCVPKTEHLKHIYSALSIAHFVSRTYFT